MVGRTAHFQYLAYRFNGLSCIQKMIRILKFTNDLFRIMTFPFRHSQVSLPEGQMGNSQDTCTSLRKKHQGDRDRAYKNIGYHDILYFSIEHVSYDGIEFV